MEELPFVPGIIEPPSVAAGAAAAKASGGTISTYGGKTIHTFRAADTFSAPASFNETVEYVVIGGGGSGAALFGGGGAGGYRT